MPPVLSYPRALRGPAGHAASFRSFLSRLEAPRGRANARAWLLGRGQEIDCFVRQVVSDARSGLLTEVEAASVVERYLDALHAGLARHFGEPAPWCCSASTRVTVVAAPLASTPTPVRPPPRPARAEGAVLIDELLARLLVGGPR